VKQSIREEDEFVIKTVMLPDKQNDEELANYNKTFNNKIRYNAITTAFKNLWGTQESD